MNIQVFSPGAAVVVSASVVVSPPLLLFPQDAKARSMIDARIIATIFFIFVFSCFLFIFLFFKTNVPLVGILVSGKNDIITTIG